MWHLLRNRLPTKDNLMQRHVLHQTHTTCISGCGDSEMATHLFLHCDIFGSLWSHVWRWLQISLVLPTNIRQFFIQFTHMAGLPRFTPLFSKIRFLIRRLLLKRLKCTFFYGWNLNRRHLATVIMIGGNIHFCAGVSTCNYILFLVVFPWWGHLNLVNTFRCFASCTPCTG